MDEAQIRGLVRRPDLLATVRSARGRRGAAALRAAPKHAGDPTTLTRSEAEARLFALVQRARLPPPRVNARVSCYEVDFLWPDHRLVVEVDGYAFHSSRAAFERDRLRDAELRTQGLDVMRVT